ncbi:thiamine pyrophosphate-dependent enzyme [Streptomyces umbrinus]|uniref:thiamine pyrophosphate-dependent enzyme n=1 Tax=Streptomyces umbrinus TaxID=67370 RepID=UPI00216B5A07|nr:thiamine pyrophosphate-dependent enzyme [Streptomyces umbrinus]
MRWTSWSASAGAQRSAWQKRRAAVTLRLPLSPASRELRPGTQPLRLCGRGGAMAWGLPAAMGMALARPEERVVALSGDGSFWMVAQGFETCVRERIPVTNLVVNKFAYGNTRDRQRFAHDERYSGVFLDNPDFAAFARMLGGYGARVTRDTDLRATIDDALAQPGPSPGPASST